MFPLLMLLLFPILEIAVFIEVGGLIGAWPTVGLVILAGVLGAVLVRWQGLAALRQAQAAADRGEVPVGAVFHGFCIVLAGFLLILPGFITDVLGLILFLPFLRSAVGRWAFDRLRARGDLRMWKNGRPVNDVRPPPQHPAADHPPRPPAAGRVEVIDAEYREVEPDAPEAPRRPDTERDADPGPEGSRWAPPGSKFRGDR